MAFENTRANQAQRDDASQESNSQEESRATDARDESVQEDSTASEEESSSDEGQEEIKEVQNETPRERALRAEVTRLKRERRGEQESDAPSKPEPSSDYRVTPAEAALYNSWQEEVVDSLISEYPQYGTDDGLWKQFEDAVEERISIVDFAKRKGVPVTKKLIEQRLKSVHNSLGLDLERAEERGRMEASRNLSRARIASSSSRSGMRRQNVPTQRHRVLPKRARGLKSWGSKKK